MEAVLFFLAAIGALGGAIGVVAMRNPFYSVLALIVHLFSLAVLFLLLTSAFVAAAQVVVYAGAVMVLYVFVVAYVGGGGESGLGADPGPALPRPRRWRWRSSSSSRSPSSPPPCSPSAPTAPTSPPASATPPRSAACCSKSSSSPSRPRPSSCSSPPSERSCSPAVTGRARSPDTPPKRSEEVPSGPDEHRVVHRPLSALLFATGAVGILVRRSPMVILLCLELMLNAGNLALVAFSRMVGNQQGQVFAIVVMVIAACEVVVGLGLIVAIFRRKLPLNVDDLRELRG